VSDLKTPVDVAEWIVEQLMEMFDARQNNEWDAIYLGEEV
jgi:hypothetical protein